MAVHTSGFLVTRGTSHEGVGMQSSLLSLSRFHMPLLQADCGDFVMSRLPASNASHTHTHTHRELLFSFSFLSVAFWVIKDAANK